MPLFKLPFEENLPITVPPVGQAQPLAERATGLTGVVATGALGAGTLGLISGGGMGTGVATTGGLAFGDGDEDGVGRVVTARGACPLKRIVCPG